MKIYLLPFYLLLYIFPTLVWAQQQVHDGFPNDTLGKVTYGLYSNTITSEAGHGRFSITIPQYREASDFASTHILENLSPDFTYVSFGQGKNYVNFYRVQLNDAKSSVLNDQLADQLITSVENQVRFLGKINELVMYRTSIENINGYYAVFQQKSSGTKQTKNLILAQPQTFTYILFLTQIKNIGALFVFQGTNLDPSKNPNAITPKILNEIKTVNFIPFNRFVASLKVYN
jgi:hypothetical protein